MACLRELWASQVALAVRNLPANAGDVRDTGLILESGRSPGEGNGYSLQCSCLENSVDRGDWQATQSIDLIELDMTKQLTLSFHFYVQ